MHIAMPNRRGFTLVELLVAIALISIMLGLAVPSFSDCEGCLERLPDRPP